MFCILRITSASRRDVHIWTHLYLKREIRATSITTKACHRLSMLRGGWNKFHHIKLQTVIKIQNQSIHNFPLIKKFSKYADAEDNSKISDRTKLQLLTDAGYCLSKILDDVSVSELSCEDIRYYLKVIQNVGKNVYPSPKLVMFVHDHFGRKKLTKEDKVEITDADIELKIMLVEDILQCSREDIERMKYAPVRKRSNIPYFLQKVNFLLSVGISVDNMRKYNQLFATSLEKLRERFHLIKSAESLSVRENCLQLLVESTLRANHRSGTFHKIKDQQSHKYDRRLGVYKDLAENLNVRFSKKFVKKITLLEEMNFSPRELCDMDVELLSIDISLLPLVIEDVRSTGVHGNVLSHVYSHRIKTLVQEAKSNRINSKNIARLLNVSESRLRKLGVRSLSPRSHVTVNIQFLQSVGFTSHDLLTCLPVLCTCPEQLEMNYRNMMKHWENKSPEPCTPKSQILNCLLYNMEKEKAYKIVENETFLADHVGQHGQSEVYNVGGVASESGNCDSESDDGDSKMWDNESDNKDNMKLGFNCE